MVQGEKTPRIRVAAIIHRQDALLLVRHLKNGRSTWLLPGGGVDYGESLATALIREVREETQLHIAIANPVLIADSIAPDGSRHTVNICFTATITGGTLALGNDPRVAEARFVSAAELSAASFHPNIRRELLEGFQSGFRECRYLGVRWTE